MSNDALLAKIAEDIGQIKESLREHMRRTEAAEARLTLLEAVRPITLMGIGKFLGGAGLLAGTVKAVYEGVKLLHLF